MSKWDYEKELEDEVDEKDEIKRKAEGMSREDAIEIYKELYTVETWTKEKMIEINAAGLRLRWDNVPKPSHGIFESGRDEELDKKQARIRAKGYLVLGKRDKAAYLINKFEFKF